MSSDLDSAIPVPASAPSRFPALVVMGVSGCGKSSLGSAVAQVLGWPLLEGDAYHPTENLAKMRAGTGLTDADRDGWLARLGLELTRHSPCVLTCSALRRRYRDRLRAARAGLAFAFMELPQAEALARVAARGGEHFFPPSLVADQFATLESPVGEERVLRLDALRPLPELVAAVGAWMR